MNNIDTTSVGAPATPALRILIIEDDPSINDIICKRLSKDGYDIVAAFSGSEAKMLLESRTFDLVITDLMLPGITGDEIVKLVRDGGAATPIIIVSARTSTTDKVDLLTLGADDYLVKPFDLDELAARVLVQLRKSAAFSAALDSSESSDNPSSCIVQGCLQLDPHQRKVSVSGEEVSLTRTEFDMLHLMMSHPKQVFSKQELYEHVWCEPYPGQENSVNAHISNIRAKLKGSAADGCIQTVWGIGFKFDMAKDQT